MKKVFRKMRLTTNVKLMKRLFCMVLFVSLAVVAYAKSESKEIKKTDTYKRYISKGYYVQGKFDVSITETRILLWKISTIGGVSGEAEWTNGSGNEVDYAYEDTALPYAVYRFSYDEGGYVTTSSEFIPYWAYASVGTLDCVESYMYKPRLWDAVSRSTVTYAKKSTISVTN